MNWLPVLALAFGLAAPMPKEAPKKAEPPAIVGEWECTQCTGGGFMVPVGEVKQIGYEFTPDGKVRARFGGKVHEGTYSTDLTKDPSELDYTVGKAVTSHGIFKIEKDTLVFCFFEGGTDRPTKFESPVGTKIMLMTFRRAEKKKE